MQQREKTNKQTNKNFLVGGYMFAIIANDDEIKYVIQ